MKNENLVCRLVAVMIIVLFGGMVFGAGGSSQSSGLWSSINLPGFDFYYGTSENGEMTSFNAGMNNTDRISNVNITVSCNATDPSRGYVFASFSGIVGDPAAEMDYMSQSTNFTRRGVYYSSNVGLSSYQQVTSWIDGQPIYGDWMSSGNVNLSLMDVTATSATMNYNEFTNQYSGNTYYNGYVEWQLDFNSPAAAAMYTSFVPTSVGPIAPVPEPSTIALIISGIAAIGIWAWRKKR